MKKIKINEISLYFLKKKKQKTIRLSINKKGEPILSTPFLYPEKKAIEWAKSKIEWITENQKKINTTKFKIDDTINILEKNLTIKPKNKGLTEAIDNILFVKNDEQFIHRRVTDFAKKEFQKYAYKQAITYANKIQKNINKIQLKSTTSRWGSCSSKNNINLNWKLCFAPLYVIDYVIAHEVAHLKEMNHSKNFWKTVSLFNTEQSKAQTWLRKNGKTIQNIE